MGEKTPVRPPCVRLVATATSMVCTSSRPLGARYRRLTSHTSAELKRIMPDLIRMSSLPYLRRAATLSECNGAATAGCNSCVQSARRCWN